MEKQTQASRPSHGWLAFFSLIYVVLLVMFASALGLTLTVGTPNRVAETATTPANLKRITAAANRTVLVTANRAGIVYAPTTSLVPPAAVKQLVTTGVKAAGDFQHQLDVAPLQRAVTHWLTQANAAQHVSADATVRAAVAQAVRQRLARSVNTELMRDGWGAAYPMIVLVLQTATIVSGILGLLVVVLMRLSSHSWRRWLRVTGRLTYACGFLGGIAAIVLGQPSILRGFHIGGLPPAVFVSVLQQFSPTWQRVAGITVVVGLVLALVADVLRPPALPTRPEAPSTSAEHDQA
ncbi:hypothetical protein [Lacticaseibacillus nasuensis]|uniref:Uncharacterized protein n=1 Tax=Lacticaseibacillus nasuensis JCM 17158 TaxID=1291734 RepID=A0A0R1JI31_9LACO|nr:hypothetical protein [Lacticaseibacillus nasuensis]KRK70943.1 hypothetical protein FD02_GL000124 [Lacticaseibacillus nasuensis JCM 17158]